VTRVAVEVSAEGHPLRSRVVEDPGGGFGEVAANCALFEQYVPGLDRAGHPATTWATVRVVFDPFMATK